MLKALRSTLGSIRAYFTGESAYTGARKMGKGKQLKAGGADADYENAPYMPLAGSTWGTSPLQPLTCILELKADIEINANKQVVQYMVSRISLARKERAFLETVSIHVGG